MFSHSTNEFGQKQSTLFLIEEDVTKTDVDSEQSWSAGRDLNPRMQVLQT